MDTPWEKEELFNVQKNCGVNYWGDATSCEGSHSRVKSHHDGTPFLHFIGNRNRKDNSKKNLKNKKFKNILSPS